MNFAQMKFRSRYNISFFHLLQNRILNSAKITLWKETCRKSPSTQLAPGQVGRYKNVQFLLPSFLYLRSNPMGRLKSSNSHPPPVVNIDNFSPLGVERSLAKKGQKGEKGEGWMREKEKKKSTMKNNKNKKKGEGKKNLEELFHPLPLPPKALQGWPPLRRAHSKVSYHLWELIPPQKLRRRPQACAGSTPRPITVPILESSVFQLANRTTRQTPRAARPRCTCSTYGASVVQALTIISILPWILFFCPKSSWAGGKGGINITIKKKERKKLIVSSLKEKSSGYWKLQLFSSSNFYVIIYRACKWKIYIYIFIYIVLKFKRKGCKFFMCRLIWTEKRKKIYVLWKYFKCVI